MPIKDNLGVCYNDDISNVKNVKKLKPALLDDVLKLCQGKDIYFSVDIKTSRESDLLSVV